LIVETLARLRSRSCIVDGEAVAWTAALELGSQASHTVAAMSLGTRIVICGGGAIGAAIAYFTNRRGARSTVIERHEVAGAASGKSGGFLALDWCRGSSLECIPLSKRVR
jgi:NADPH-dependent 2,4-dienoyl-CoA reductase/sulfur reductase-like enzyme